MCERRAHCRARAAAESASLPEAVGRHSPPTTTTMAATTPRLYATPAGLSSRYPSARRACDGAHTPAECLCCGTTSMSSSSAADRLANKLGKLMISSVSPPPLPLCKRRAKQSGAEFLIGASSSSTLGCCRRACRERHDRRRWSWSLLSRRARLAAIAWDGSLGGGPKLNNCWTGWQLAGWRADCLEAVPSGRTER